jgi:hypothetical protein
VFYGLVDIDQMHQTKQGEGIERTVEESSVGLAPFVTSESAITGVLKASND